MAKEMKMKKTWLVCLGLLLAMGCGQSNSNSTSNTDSQSDSSVHTDTHSNFEQDTSTDDTSSKEVVAQDTSTNDTSSEIDTAIPVGTDTDFVVVPITGSITDVQPMTGIVLWHDNPHSDESAISLEYTYMAYNAIAVHPVVENWDWGPLELFLDSVAAQGHQGIVRFYFVYPGDKTTVPTYIKETAGYQESTGITEEKTTDFPDWTNEALQEFVQTFYTELASKYDNDARLAFLQVGFGLWAEYHIYEPGVELGVNFPSKAFQETFFKHLANSFQTLHWNVSIDSADQDTTPFGQEPALKNLRFGLFDDSFLHKDHNQYNKDCFDFFGVQKRMVSPVGGELSYYETWDQAHALDANGPYNIPFEQLAQTYNVTYMIGNDQPNYQSINRIKEAGMATGYRFELNELRCASDHCAATIYNRGIAPIYYNAYPAVNGHRSANSLKGLLPGQFLNAEIAFEQDATGAMPTFSIECDRLVAGQTIQFQSI